MAGLIPPLCCCIWRSFFVSLFLVCSHPAHLSTAASYFIAGPPPLSVTKRVLREFAALHHELTEVAGVRVNLFQHRCAC